VFLLVKTSEEMAEEAETILKDIAMKAEEGELDNKMVASFVGRTTHLLKDLAEAMALLQQRVDVISKKP
jgi:gamma-glutamyl:cysteine ligase YbdK (ATP-grasp superfamily)